MIFSPIILEASWLWVMETNKYLISLEEPLGANLKFWLKTEGAYARGRGGGVITIISYQWLLEQF